MNLFKRLTTLRLAATIALTSLTTFSPAQAQTSYDIQQQAIQQYMYRYGSCSSGQQPSMMFQTKDFNITICNDQIGNYTYNGHERGTNNRISLPAESLPDTYCGEGWEAHNGNYSYVVTTDILVVRELTSGGINSMVMNQPVIDIYAPYWDRC